MAKTSKKQIEEDERKIITELQKNAKESIDVIAKKCGFSRQKVWLVIKRLEKTRPSGATPPSLMTKKLV